MGQADIIDFLEKQKEPIPVRVIAQQLQVNIKQVSKILRKLIDHQEIKFIELDRVQARKKYGLKRRAREYYVEVSIREEEEK